MWALNSLYHRVGVTQGWQRGMAHDTVIGRGWGRGEDGIILVGIPTLHYLDVYSCRGRC